MEMSRRGIMGGRKAELDIYTKGNEEQKEDWTVVRVAQQWSFIVIEKWSERFFFRCFFFYLRNIFARIKAKNFGCLLKTI